MLPFEEDGDDSSAILGDFPEGRLSQIEVLERGIAPATIVISQCVVGRAEISGSDCDGTGEAPLRIIVAAYLVACAAAEATVEKRRA